jgi:hypothetical protein
MESTSPRDTGQPYKGLFRVVRVEPGTLWLESEEGDAVFGAFSVPVPVSDGMVAGLGLAVTLGAQHCGHRMTVRQWSTSAASVLAMSPSASSCRWPHPRSESIGRHRRRG